MREAMIALPKFWSVVRTELRLAHRERIFLITLPAVLALDLVILPQLLPHAKTFAVIASKSTELLKFILIFCAIFPPVESIIRDVSDNRDEILFSAPISTTSFLIAKFTTNVLHVLGLILLLLVFVVYEIFRLRMDFQKADEEALVMWISFMLSN